MTLLEKLQNVTSEVTHREYIGASSIGHPCMRKVWYDFHMPDKKEKTEARTQRIFWLGHKVEELVIELFKQAKIKVLRPSVTFYDESFPYIQGHIDGLLPDHNMVLEIKSCKHSSFNIFKKKGLKDWFPAYYPQVQCYMKWTQMPKAYVLAFNKDNAELHSEIVKFDAKEYEYILNKAKSIYNSRTEPPRLSNNPAWFQCKNCEFHNYCHIEGRDK